MTLGELKKRIKELEIDHPELTDETIIKVHDGEFGELGSPNKLEVDLSFLWLLVE